MAGDRTKHPVYGWDMATCVRCGRPSVYAAMFESQLCLACVNVRAEMPIADAMREIFERRARARRGASQATKRPERDPLWREFVEAALRADGERLADIGDWVHKGVPVELFRLTPNERIVVDAYLDGSVPE